MVGKFVIVGVKLSMVVKRTDFDWSQVNESFKSCLYYLLDDPYTAVSTRRNAPGNILQCLEIFLVATSEETSSW